MHSMSEVVSDAELESLIIPTKWTDKDAEIVVQAMIDERMGLETATSLD